LKPWTWHASPGSMPANAPGGSRGPLAGSKRHKRIAAGEHGHPSPAPPARLPGNLVAPYKMNRTPQPMYKWELAQAPSFASRCGGLRSSRRWRGAKLERPDSWTACAAHDRPTNLSKLGHVCTKRVFNELSISTPLSRSNPSEQIFPKLSGSSKTSKLEAPGPWGRPSTPRWVAARDALSGSGPKPIPTRTITNVSENKKSKYIRVFPLVRVPKRVPKGSSGP